MKEIHWSRMLVNFITVEIIYSNDDRQTWDYDCSQFINLNAVKNNMAIDFATPREDWSTVTVSAAKGSTSVTFELEDFTLRGSDFANYVIDSLGEELWQPVAVS